MGPIYRLAGSYIATVQAIKNNKPQTTDLQGGLPRGHYLGQGDFRIGGTVGTEGLVYHMSRQNYSQT